MVVSPGTSNGDIDADGSTSRGNKGNDLAGSDDEEERTDGGTREGWSQRRKR